MCLKRQVNRTGYTGIKGSWSGFSRTEDNWTGSRTEIVTGLVIPVQRVTTGYTGTEDNWLAQTGTEGNDWLYWDRG